MPFSAIFHVFRDNEARNQVTMQDFSDSTLSICPFYEENPYFLNAIHTTGEQGLFYLCMLIDVNSPFLQGSC